MFYLEDILSVVETFGLVEEGHLYMGKLDAKKQKSIGIYNLKRRQAYTQALGGKQNESYGVKQASFLVHWNKSPRDTEKVAMGLFERLEGIKETEVNGKRIKFVLPLTKEPVDVGTDEASIYEMVIETEFFYEKGTGE